MCGPTHHLSAVAEAERDRTRERIAPDVATLAASFGWRVDEAGELVPIPEKQATIRRMRKLRDQRASRCSRSLRR